MSSLSRTISQESRASYQTSYTDSAEVDQLNTPSTIDISQSSVLDPSSPIKTESSKAARSKGTWSRALSHSLLSTLPNSGVTSRKGRFADPGTTGAVGRASISMPPPVTKPSSTYKPSAIRRPSTLIVHDDKLDLDGTAEHMTDGNAINQSTMIEDLDKTPSMGGFQSSNAAASYSPLTLPDSSLRPFNPLAGNADNEGNRLSFSSQYSLGSAIHNGTTGGSSAPSATSSITGSVRSAGLDQPAIMPLPTSPPLGSVKAEASAATTATNPVSVTANSLSPHARSYSGLAHVFQTLLSVWL